MPNVGGAQTFDRYWNEVFRQLTSNLDYAITSSGDRLIIADRSPSLLLRAAQGLLGQLENSGYHLQMRIGAHSGFWRLNQELEGIAQPEISDIGGVAARAGALDSRFRGNATTLKDLILERRARPVAREPCVA